MLYSIKFNLDLLSDSFKPLKEKILPNSRVGFVYDVKGGQRNETYMSVKNVISPRILLYDSHLDTLLIIQKANYLKLDYANYKIIYCLKDDSLNVFLAYR